tara:strand:+ start:239 stop:379 length:141 start_codon:yes stop_codon:yes gene_type:complete
MTARRRSTRALQVAAAVSNDTSGMPRRAATLWDKRLRDVVAAGFAV